MAKPNKTDTSVPLEQELLACIGRLLAEGATCDVSWQVVDGDLEARISVFGHSVRCLEDYERVFGRTWQRRAQPHPPGHHTIEYVWRSATVSQALTLTFRGDGSVSHALIVVRATGSLVADRTRGT